MKPTKNEADEICELLTSLINKGRDLNKGWTQALEVGINDIARNAIKDEMIRVDEQLHQIIHGRIHARLETLQKLQKQTNK